MKDLSCSVHRGFSCEDDDQSVRHHLKSGLVILLLLVLAAASGFVVVSGAGADSVWDDALLIGSAGAFLVLILLKVGERITSSVHEHSRSEQDQENPDESTTG